MRTAYSSTLLLRLGLRTAISTLAMGYVGNENGCRRLEEHRSVGVLH